YPIGNAPPSQPSCSLNVGGTVTVTWSAAAGATSYDVLRTSGFSLPSGSASIAVATGVTGTSQSDTLSAPSSYTITTAATAAASIALDNLNNASPRISVNGASLAAAPVPCV